jgi:hypothetical protein
VSHDLRELLAHVLELVFPLGERAAADATHSQPLQLADAVSDVAEKALDVTLSLGVGHAVSLRRLHETRVSPRCEAAL